MSRKKLKHHMANTSRPESWNFMGASHSPAFSSPHMAGEHELRMSDHVWLYESARNIKMKTLF